jgi:hypothetical protein
MGRGGGARARRPLPPGAGAAGPRRPSARRAGRLAAPLAALLAAGSGVASSGLVGSRPIGTHGVAAAQDPLEGIAGFFARATTVRWAGARVPRPAIVPRPVGAVPLGRAAFLPLTVHGDPAVVAPAVAADALAALEEAAVLLARAGWPAPYPDGGRGGTAGFDLYLGTPEELARPSESDGRRGAGPGYEARADADALDPFFDAAVAHAVVDASLPPEDLAACVAAAYVDAALLGQDPAEAPEWRRATGAYAAFLVTGRFGCDDAAVRAAAAEPWRAPVADASDYDREPARSLDARAAPGAVFLASLDAYRTAGTGWLAREAWQFTRQRTWEGYGLRGSPQLFEVFDKLFPHDDEQIHDVLEALAVRRYLAGVGHPAPGLAPLALPPQPAAGPFAWSALPKKRSFVSPPLEPWGVAYARVDTRAAREGEALRVWLRGEGGVRWLLAAVRLSADGRDLGRVSAPVTQAHNAYLRLDLTPDTAEVLVVAIDLSSRLPSADTTDVNERGLELVLDKAS